MAKFARKSMLSRISAYVDGNQDARVGQMLAPFDFMRQIPYRCLTGTLPIPYRFKTCISSNVYAGPYRPYRSSPPRGHPCPARDVLTSPLRLIYQTSDSLDRILGRVKAR